MTLSKLNRLLFVFVAALPASFVGIAMAQTTSPKPIAVPHLDPVKGIDAMSEPALRSNTKFVIAHRGYHSAPGCAENSECSIREAYYAGADGIEFDIKIAGDGSVVLGHDFTIGRELVDTTPRTWTPFSEFPLTDRIYRDLTSLPFLLNRDVNDPANPRRNEFTGQSLGNHKLRDTYDQPTPENQENLLNVLKVVRYYPMMVWLDVKSWKDLEKTVQVIHEARQHWGATGVLAKICFKLAWSTLAGAPGGFNPSSALNEPDLYYFLVFGTGDFDAMSDWAKINATFGDPNAAIRAFDSVCTRGNGCLGGELAHKYPGAPTQTVFDFMRKRFDSGQGEIAAFHTVPQYAWFWNLQEQDRKAATYGRWYPRTDGSCCFAPTDTLNISNTYNAAESYDLRPSFEWNENNFTSITTDEPALALRDLFKKGYRNPNLLRYYVLNPNNDLPSSGGNASDLGPLKDGLYWIKTDSRLLKADMTLATLTENQSSTAYMWYLTNRPSGSYTLTNAQTSGSISFETNSERLSTAPADDTSNFLWRFLADGTAFRIRNQQFNVGIDRRGAEAFRGTGSTQWELAPVSAAIPEQAAPTNLPAGYTFCADAESNTLCNFTGLASVAYGANGQFRYLNNVSGPVPCQTSSFNNIDPIYGVRKTCSYAPYVSNPEITKDYRYVSAEGGALLPSSAGQPYAFGPIYPNAGTGKYTYKTLNSETECNSATFGYDPAPYIVKGCFATFADEGPQGFTFCSSERNVCAFSGTAAIAYGVPGSGKWTYKTLTNGVSCSNPSFGTDPAMGSPKACYYLASTPFESLSLDPELPGSHFKRCAAEGGTCTQIPLGSLVAFGYTSNGRKSFDFLTNMSTSFQCGTSTFNNIDPAPGIQKSCSWAPQSYVNRGPSGFTYCAPEGGTCRFSGAAQAAYGADGRYQFLKRIASGPNDEGFRCETSTFKDNDPYQKMPKACYYRLY